MGSLNDDQKSFFSNEAGTLSRREDLYQITHDKESVTASTGTLILNITTGTRAVEVLGFEVRADVDDIRIQTFEDSTSSGGGAPTLAPTSMNRVAPVASSVTITTDPSVTVEGTKIGDRRVKTASGQGSSQTGVDTSGMTSTLLKKSTQHLIKITNLDSTAATIAIVLVFAEGE